MLGIQTTVLTCINCLKAITLLPIVCSTFSVRKSKAAGMATETRATRWESLSNACTEDKVVCNWRRDP